MRRGLAVQQFIDEELASKIQVSDAETKSYYDSHPKYFEVPEKVQASHILIKVDSEAGAEAKAGARKRMEAVRVRAKNGEDFAKLAREFSEGPSGSKGGELGYFSREQMVKPFSDAAFALEPGQVSDIVETRYGYHIIKVSSKSEATKTGYDEVKGKIADYLKQKKLNQKVSERIAQLKKTAKIETFLVEDQM
jgi:peptidyl-prolyl cis-trans isomerase C